MSRMEHRLGGGGGWLPEMRILRVAGPIVPPGRVVGIATAAGLRRRRTCWRRQAAARYDGGGVGRVQLRLRGWGQRVVGRRKKLCFFNLVVGQVSGSLIVDSVSSQVMDVILKKTLIINFGQEAQTPISIFNFLWSKLFLWKNITQYEYISLHILNELFGHLKNK